jgi:hypothetical protein
VGQSAEVVVGVHRDTAHRAQRPRLDADDLVAVPAEPVEFRPRQAEDFNGDAELEHAELVIGKDGDVAAGGKGGHHGGILPHIGIPATAGSGQSPAGLRHPKPREA